MEPDSSVNAEASPRLVWMDLEMTGLNPNVDQIIALAVVITEVGDLRPLRELELVIAQPEHVLRRAPDVVRTMHERSGLFDRVRHSRTLLGQAEQAAYELVSAYCRPREGVLAGNSVWQDRRFLATYMPTLESYLHYRLVDVTTLKILARAWFGEAGYYRKSLKSHTALEDVHASIDELRFYRDLVGATAAHAHLGGHRGPRATI